MNDEVGQPGIEPGTSVLSGLRSNRLSYWPKGAAPGPEHERRAPLPAREDTRGDTQAPTAWTPEGGRSITTRTGSARTSTSEEQWGAQHTVPACRSTTRLRRARNAGRMPNGIARDRSTWGWTAPPCETEARPSVPRKEVIQPHLPVRLPCYDFVPIAGTTLGGWVHMGSLTDFRRLQLS
jgi:hypothetical protein